MATASRALASSFKPFLHPPLPPSLSTRPLLYLPTTTSSARRLISSPGVIFCLVSDLDGGGPSDTRNSEFTRGFAVIADMLKRIEPFDASAVSQGVSESAKESMKQTISTMLGLLPSDQFSVSVRVSELPLHHLFFSSIITGYTLWNAEYRISLMRNFELSPDSGFEPPMCLEDGDDLELWFEELLGGDGQVSSDDSVSRGGGFAARLNNLSPKAHDYIRQLEAELCAVEKELDIQKQYRLGVSSGGKNNNLLEYLRSLESQMVAELSQPSSMEVAQVIQQLSRNIMLKVFRTDSHDSTSAIRGKGDHHRVSDNESSEPITTPRDYLAKLLFWCMLLGHHLRGLENRLHLSCAVGLL